MLVLPLVCCWWWWCCLFLFGNGQGEFNNGGGGAAADSGYSGSGSKGRGAFRWWRHRLMEATQQLVCVQ